jgi:hypothetical protein
MPKPQIVVGPNDLPKYIPVGRTKQRELIDQGLLEIVPLSLGGRVVGITMRSIIQYQRDVMGLQPLDDDEADSRAGRAAAKSPRHVSERAKASMPVSNGVEARPRQRGR